MASTKPLRLAVMGSGRGSNFVAIQEKILTKKVPAKIVVVFSDKPCAMLKKATAFGLETRYLDPKSFENRQEYDFETAKILKSYGIDIIVLAGYMRILSPDFVQQFPKMIVNIHPSLLPSFRGLHPQQQALDAGVQFSGCTVHFVTEDLDAGPIIKQAVVPVLDDDNEDSLAARILEKEHQIYSEAIRMIATQKLPKRSLL